MPGLRDIAKNLRRNVAIGDATISVRGLTATELADLLATYPEMSKLITFDFEKIDQVTLRTQAPDCVATMIALGTSNGVAPEQEDIDAARTLPGRATLDILAVIADLTLPRAVSRPFVAMIMDGEGEPLSADTGKAPDTK